MSSVTASRLIVAVCSHCGGTGLCGEGNHVSDHHHEWLECPECGRGVPGVVGAEFQENDHRPVCSKCHGQGIIEEEI